MKEKLISIIVPIYNVKDYVQRCINSACGQTYHRLEIILVDDGSTDGSGDICDAAKKQDDRIFVIHKANGGISDARNAGLAYAHGEYIAFLDADDVYEKHFIEILAELCEENQADIAMGELKPFEKELPFQTIVKEEPQILSGKEALYRIVGKKHIQYTTVYNKLYRKEVFAEKRFATGMIHEDEEIMYRLFYDASKIVCVDTVLYGYFSRENSIMTSAYSKKRLDALKMAKRRAEFFQEKGEKELHDLFLWSYGFLLLQHYPRVKKDLKQPQLAKQLKREYRRIAPTLMKSPYLSKKKKAVIGIFYLVPGWYAEIMRKKMKYFH